VLRINQQCYDLCFCVFKQPALLLEDRDRIERLVVAGMMRNTEGAIAADGHAVTTTQPTRLLWDVCA
jgi:hypothetical protein